MSWPLKGLGTKTNAGGNVVGVTNGSGQSLPIATTVHNSFLARSVAGPLFSAAGPVANNFLVGMNSPVNFSSYRLTYHHLGGNGPVIGFKAIVSATDDVGNRDFTDVTAAAFKKTVTPKRAGVTYNTLVTDGSPGWKAVTWNGSATLDIPDPGAGNIVSVSSDLIYDTGAFDGVNGFYPLLIRYFNGSGSVSLVNNLTGQQVGTQAKTDFPSIFFMALSRGAGDAVTDPTLWSDANTPNATSSAPAITVEFFTQTKALTVMAVADSRFGVSAETTSQAYRSAENYLKKAFDALNVPASVLRHGQSGIASSIYGPYALPDFLLETKPDWLVYIMYSRNPSSTFLETDTNIAICKAQTLRMVEAARKAGTKVLLIPALPTGLSGNSSYTAPQLANLKSLLPFAQSLADIVYDGLTRWGNADGSWLPGVAYDAPHMTNATELIFAQELAAAIAAY